MFTELEIQRFRRHDEHLQRLANTKNRSTTYTHKRGYRYGDLHCTNCKKWLNPNRPDEAREIRYGARMNRLHLNCPVYSPYPATLIMFSKFHGARGRVNEVPRY